MKSLYGFLILGLVAVILVSGCAQGPPKTTKSQQESTISSVAPTPTLLPTDVTASGDVLGSELANSDQLEADLANTDLDQASADLAALEAGL